MIKEHQSLIEERPTPKGESISVGKRFLILLNDWKKQNGQNTPMPRGYQDEAWDIAFNPTEKVEILSRKGNSRGISMVVDRKPSFLK